MSAIITKTVAAICIAVAGLLTTKQAFAQEECGQPVTIYISTGIDNFNNLLSPGSPDPNWVAPSGMGNVVTPHPLWTTLTASGWLGDNNYAPALTTFTYYRYFYVPPTATNATIAFSSLVDNYLDIYVDGTLVGSPAGFMIPDIFSYSSPLTPTTSGWHVVQADVTNDDGPAGLDLLGTVTYQPVTVTEDISTGVNGGPMPAGSGLLAMGVNDPNWSVSPSGYNITESPSWAWGSFTGSLWLGIGNSTTTSPSGYYTYSRSFTLPSTGGILTFESIADDACLYYLDGSTSPLAGTVGAASGNGFGYELKNKAKYTGTVDCGPHTLTAVVRNCLNCGYTVVGFNLHGSVTYCDNGLGCEVIGEGKPSGSALAIPVKSAQLKELALYPNPARDEIRFSKSLSQCDLRVINNLDGRTVLEIKQFSGGKIDISALAAGSYTLRVIQDNNVATLKFSKIQ